jgi:hypothetical protein
MAGTIIADFIRTDASRLSLNVGNTTFATINASGFLSNTGTTIIAANGQISGASIISSSLPGTAFATAAIPSTKIGTGAVLQVKTVYKQDTFTSTSSSYVDVTGLSVSITPTSATSNILVLGAVTYGASSDVGFIRLVRNSTAIQVGTGVGNRLSATAQMRNSTDSADGDSAAIAFLDSPSSTSAVTYKVQIASAPGGYTTRINSSADDPDQTNRGRTASTLIVMEIAG